MTLGVMQLLHTHEAEQAGEDDSGKQLVRVENTHYSPEAVLTE